MQEQVNEKTVALYIKTGKLTAEMLQRAMKKLLSQMKKQADRPPHGKQTLKQLMKQNAGVSNIEITGENIKAFESTAKKYYIDFALKKKLTQDKKPSIRKLLSDFRQKAAALNVQREQVKNKDRGRER